ncbi:ATP-binding protein [Streptomyces sp. SID12501]|uniref:ATP-binding protein n=1 Tax=Streptomyces sp. SID12501 TaxID=2706042 RepID=A0A6B3C3M9_9ACTN|nr:ATP-binding protein [Streptomyces sp. SID12501]NEC91269.1 ATP-binding protein [Streptomyces sp. SID12501]
MPEPTSPQPRQAITFRIPKHPRNVPDARTQVRKALADWGLPAELAADIALVATEFVTNSVRHCEVTFSLVEVSLTLHGDYLLLEVSDPDKEKTPAPGTPHRRATRRERTRVDRHQRAHRAMGMRPAPVHQVLVGHLPAAGSRPRMFRLTARLVTRLAAALRLRTPSPPAIPAVTQPPRIPDPYVWTLPSPHHARWRRWHRRKNPTDLLLPEEDCWQPPPPPRPLNWTTTDDVVRLYVLQDLGEDRRPPQSDLDHAGARAAQHAEVLGVRGQDGHRGG